MAAAEMVSPDTPHVPVLIDALIRGVAPVEGAWIDGTFGAGGYTERLFAAGATRILGIDRDPSAQAAGHAMQARHPGFQLATGTFSQMDSLADGPVDGVVLDLGVSSMQLDMAERGFSFMRDGPLDMRMSGQGPSAADLVNTAQEAMLADILYHYGEERAARRIAKAIVAKRPFETTLQLAETVASQLPRPKPGQSHPATRSFQALRIAVNEEFRELAAGLEAAERILKPGGALAVVSFHSLEDRVVKRFMQSASGAGGTGNRYAPEAAQTQPRFKLTPRKAIAPSEAEVDANPRARSALLRIARRTDAPALDPDRSTLGLPGPSDWWSR